MNIAVDDARKKQRIIDLVDAVSGPMIGLLKIIGHGGLI